MGNPTAAASRACRAGRRPRRASRQPRRRSTMRTRVVAGIAALIAAGALGGAASSTAPAEAPCWNFSSSQGQCVNSRLSIGGTSYSVDWYLPSGTASGLMLLEHGFFRTCPNLRGTSKAIMEKGVMVLCVNADMTGGNPTLGRALGDLLASRELAPPGRQGPPGALCRGRPLRGRPFRRRRRRTPRRGRLSVARGRGAVRPGRGRGLHRQPPGDLRRRIPTRPLGRVGFRRSRTCSTTASAP